MKKKKIHKQLHASLLALLLILSLCISPISKTIVYAEEDIAVESVEEDVQEPEAVVEEEIASITETTETIEPTEEKSEEEVLLEEETSSEEDNSDETTVEEPSDAEDLDDASDEEDIIDASDVTGCQLVYGDENLADEDALVLLIFGDGFTAEEQDKFFEEAKNTVEYVMATSPWDEFTDTIKFYAIGTVSNESGARADNAQTQAEADADTRDTYLGTTFWTGGMQRLLTVGNEGRAKMSALQAEYVPAADYSVIIVNSTVYGGSGGSICLASLNTESLEMMLHELGHTVADLADEYWAGESYAKEYANMTAESDPEKVKWSRFIGKNGIGVYEYDEGGNGWYHPSQNCKMQYLGVQFAYCEVCKEKFRQAFCQGSNVTKLFFQTYADVFYEGEGKDMSEYFILRRGSNEITGDQLGEALQLTYYDEDGNEVQGIPDEVGTYTVKAVFSGNDIYEACTQTGEYTIEPPDSITINVDSKIYDGKPIDLNYTVDYDKPYTVAIRYTGSIPYTKTITNTYDSEEAPTKPGSYQVTILAYDQETGKAVGKATKSFNISAKQTALVDNNSSEYPGAANYYNNKTIVITGEGFTAGEQDKFEELAQKYVDYIQNIEPFKETKLYFNFFTVEAESNQSGIGTEAGDTYFQLTYDENGKIVPNDTAYDAAHYIAYYTISSYYKNAIVIVNDENIKESSTSGRVIYGGTDEDSMDYVARELLNYLTGEDEGYRATTEEEIAAQRDTLLNVLYYTWYGTDYAVVVSRAYNETFVEDGTAFDLEPYFHTYALGKELPGIDYTMTYYADDNGKVGEELDGAPSAAGTYHVRAEIIPSGRTLTVETEDATFKLPKSRGWTTYTIQPAEEPGTEPSDPEEPGTEPSDPEEPGTEPSDPEEPGTEPSDPQNPEEPETEPSDPEEPGTDIQAPDTPSTTDTPGTTVKPGATNTATKTSSTSTNSAAKTGDTAPISLYFILIAISAVVLLAAGSVSIKRRRR